MKKKAHENLSFEPKAYTDEYVQKNWMLFIMSSGENDQDISDERRIGEMQKIKIDYWGEKYK